VHVFAVIGRSSGGGGGSSSGGGDDGGGDCAALRASVSAVRVCLELDPPVSDIDDVPPPHPSLLSLLCLIPTFSRCTYTRPLYPPYPLPQATLLALRKGKAVGERIQDFHSASRPGK
jgi:hypothetical protein